MATLKGLSLIHQPHLSVPLIPLAFENRALDLHHTFLKIQLKNLIYTPETTNLLAFTTTEDAVYLKKIASPIVWPLK